MSSPASQALTQLISNLREPTQLDKGTLFPAYNGCTRKFYNRYQRYRISKACSINLPGEYPIFFTFKQCRNLGGSVRKGSKSFVRSYYYQEDNESTNEEDEPVVQSKVNKGHPLFHLSQCNFSDEISQLFLALVDEIETACLESNSQDKQGIDDLMMEAFVSFLLTSDNITSYKAYKTIPELVKEQAWPCLYVDLNLFQAYEEQDE